MNGNCYYSEGVNPTLTCNKNEGNRVAIPVLTPDRLEKRQNGRRFKEDGEESFTLTSQDRHGVAIAVDVEPLEMSGYEVSENKGDAHALNANDQRKVFGAHQARTMAGYNCTVKWGGYDSDRTCLASEGLQGVLRKLPDDDGSVFAIDKGFRPEKREIANCIESREDRGLSKRRQEGTLICMKI